MSEKTLKNHIANLKAALRHLSGDKTIPARGTPLTPEWSELRKLVEHEMNRYHLTGLMRFASAAGHCAESCRRRLSRQIHELPGRRSGSRCVPSPATEHCPRMEWAASKIRRVGRKTN